MKWHFFQFLFIVPELSCLCRKRTMSEWIENWLEIVPKVEKNTQRHIYRSQFIIINNWTFIVPSIEFLFSILIAL